MIDNYNDLTLGDYLPIDAVLQGEGEEIDKQVSIIALLAGMTEEEVLALPLREYAALAARTNFLRETCPAVTPPSRLIANGLVLIPVADFTEINTAQYIDFETFSKKLPQRLPELLAVMLVPEGKKYNEGYDIAEVVSAVRDLPLPVAVGLSAFFFGQLIHSIDDSLTSLTSAWTRMPERRRKEALKTAEELRGILRGVGFPA